jgi:hypothetical protein
MAKTCEYYQRCSQPAKPCGYCSTHCLCGADVREIRDSDTHGF